VKPFTVWSVAEKKASAFLPPTTPHQLQSFQQFTTKDVNREEDKMLPNQGLFEYGDEIIEDGRPAEMVWSVRKMKAVPENSECVRK